MNIVNREDILPLTPQTYHILTALLSHNAMTGADLVRQVNTDSKGLIELSPGSAYPALRRLKAMRAVSSPTSNPHNFLLTKIILQRGLPSQGGNPHNFLLTKTGAELLRDETTRLEQVVKLAQIRLAERAKFIF